MASNGTPENNIMFTLCINYQGEKDELILPISIIKMSTTFKGLLESTGDNDETEGNIIPISNIPFNICKKVFMVLKN
jgi:hypothetical protein